MGKRVFVAGHNGMVGRAIIRVLTGDPNVELVTRDRAELDLTSAQQVSQFFSTERVDEVYLAAAKVGGINANNNYPAEFIFNNLQIQCNIIHNAHLHDVDKLLFLGSSCIYPKLAQQPMKEGELLKGYLEPTNEPYAIAKIAGIKLCESYNRQYGRDYRSVMPTNLYGPYDNFNLETSHVIPALLRKFHDAATMNSSSVVLWGTGSPRREFLHVDDMAAACVHVMDLGKPVLAEQVEQMNSHINVGTGSDVSILELAQLIAKISGFQGEIELDTSKPDGPPRKLLAVDRLQQLGWRHSIDLEKGLQATYEWYKGQSDG